MSVRTEMRPNAQINSKRETTPQSQAFGLNRQTRQTQSECQQSLQQRGRKKRIEHNIPGKDLICKTNNIFKTFPCFPNTDILYIRLSDNIYKNVHEYKRALGSILRHIISRGKGSVKSLVGFKVYFSNTLHLFVKLKSLLSYYKCSALK